MFDIIDATGEVIKAWASESHSAALCSTAPF